MADKPRILIVYSSYGGNTEKLAQAIADGARTAGNGNVDVKVKRARDTTRDDIKNANALAFGSPTYYSYMTGELKTLFDEALPHKGAFDGKPVIAFSTGEGGQLEGVQSIENIVDYLGAQLVQRSDIRSAGLAFQKVPDESTLREAKAMGRKLGDAGVEYVCRQRSSSIEVVR